MTKNADAVYKEIGKRIIAARNKKGYSQERLASESGLDRSHLGFIEQGRRHPTISTLIKICSAINFRLEDLFKGL